jgi:hypothetical protein
MHPRRSILLLMALLCPHGREAGYNPSLFFWFPPLPVRLLWRLRLVLVFVVMLLGLSILPLWILYNW